MNLHDSKGVLRNYASAEQIIEDFYEARLSLYQDRRVRMKEKLKRRRERLENQISFIKMVRCGLDKIVGSGDEAAIVDRLKSKGLKELPSEEAQSGEGRGVAHVKEPKIDAGYDYLLNMPIRALFDNRVLHTVPHSGMTGSQLT